MVSGGPAFGDPRCTPASNIVNDMWAEHASLIEEYAQFCKRCFGRLRRHMPRYVTDCGSEPCSAGWSFCYKHLPKRKYDDYEVNRD